MSKFRHSRLKFIDRRGWHATGRILAHKRLDLPFAGKSTFEQRRSGCRLFRIGDREHRIWKIPTVDRLNHLLLDRTVTGDDYLDSRTEIIVQRQKCRGHPGSVIGHQPRQLLERFFTKLAEPTVVGQPFQLKQIESHDGTRRRQRAIGFLTRAKDQIGLFVGPQIESAGRIEKERVRSIRQLRRELEPSAIGR